MTKLNFKVHMISIEFSPANIFQLEKYLIRIYKTMLIIQFNKQELSRISYLELLEMLVESSYYLQVFHGTAIDQEASSKR